MPFNHLNGDFDASDDRNQALVYNTILEQLIRLRADIVALHGCVQFLATKQGVPVEKMEELWRSRRDTSYQSVSADVLAQLRGDSGAAQSPKVFD